MARKFSNSRVTAPIEDVDLPPDHHPARRAVIAFAVFIIAVALVRAGWGAIGEHRWHAAQARMSDIPLAAPDTPPISVAAPSSPDGFSNLLRAARAAALSAMEWEKVVEVDSFRPNPSAADLAILGHVVEARPEVLADVRRARAGGEIRWPVRSGALAALEELADLNRLQNLESLLQYAPTIDHGVGDDASAVEELRDMLWVSRVAGRCPGSIAFFLSRGMSERGVIALDNVCTTLRINSMPQSAHRAQVSSLISELLDDDGFQRRMASAVSSDAADAVRWMQEVEDGRQAKIIGGSIVNGQWQPVLAPHWANWMAGKTASPYYELKEAKQLDYRMQLLRAVSATDYPALLRQLPAPLPRTERDFVFGADWVIRDFSSEPTDVWIKLCFETAAARRLAAAQLAIRWYTRDHSGWLPASLDLLVPKYLPSVPEDICARAATRIGYVPAATQPFVYSVGSDGVDDLAAGTWTAPSNASADDRFKMPDLIWYVGPSRPTSLPSFPSTRAMQGSSEPGQ